MKEIALALVGKTNKKNSNVVVHNKKFIIQDCGVDVLFEENFGYEDGVYNTALEYVSEVSNLFSYRKELLFGTECAITRDELKVFVKATKNVSKVFDYRFSNLVINDGFVYSTDKYKLKRFKVNSKITNGYVTTNFVKFLDWLMSKTNTNIVLLGRNVDNELIAIGTGFTVYSATKNYPDYPIQIVLEKFTETKLKEIQLKIEYNHKEVLNALKKVKGVNEVTFDVENQIAYAIDWNDEKIIIEVPINVTKVTEIPTVDSLIMPKHNEYIFRYPINPKYLDTNVLYFTEYNNRIIYS